MVQAEGPAPSTRVKHLLLDNVLRRIDRANYHIKELPPFISQFERENPKLGGHGLDPNDPRQIIVVAGRRNEPPPILSIVAGEALYLLRSTLDQIVAALLVSVHGVASASLTDNSSFMICRDDPILNPAKHTAKHASYWGQVPGISIEARTIINDAQPCKGADEVIRLNHPLAILDRLNNIDKHRNLIGLGHLAALRRVNIGPTMGPFILNVHSDALAGTSNYGEAETARVIMPTAQPVDMDFESSLEVAFKDIGTGRPEPVIPLLEKLSESVLALVDDFRSNCPEFKT
jgi:hypothetical protein